MMINRFPPQKKSIFRKRTLTGSVLILLLFPAFSTSADPYSLIRSGRWDRIQNFFRNRIPNQDHHRFILARAYHETAKQKEPFWNTSSMDAMRLYLSVAQIQCYGKTEDSFLNCTGSVQKESRSSLIHRLALYHASEVAEKAGLHRLRLQLLQIAKPDPADPLSARIFSDRMQILFQNGKFSEGADLADRYSEIKTPFSMLWKAKHYFKNGSKELAFNAYLQSAQSTTVSWLQKIIYRDLKQNYPELFQRNAPQPRSTIRSLIPLIQYMEEAEKGYLASTIDYTHLLASSSVSTVEHDGIYLIVTNRADRLPDYAAAYFSHISDHPDILHAWIKALDQSSERDQKAIMGLMKQFEHTKKHHSYLWKDYLSFLKKYRSRDEFFKEMIRFLQENRTDYHVFDELTRFLIGEDHTSVAWEKDSYWDYARKNLPADTGTGRFLYWLKRYYIHKKNYAKANELQETFYNHAPGSYYTRAFWDENKNGDYISDWNRVKTRYDYLNWISRHGHNDRALSFLSSKNIEPYLDPSGVELLEDLKKSSFRIPYDILTLYRLGELDLGYEFFQDRYEDSLSRIEVLKRLTIIGQKSNNLFISVYFLRRLMHETHVSEDPFSLPYELLQELYPRPYQKTVSRYSHSYGIEPEMVYGLMRQESMFRELAISRSGAMGLMQIMPATGNWMAEKMKIRNPDFFNPHTSIQIGTKYFADLLKNYDNDFRWASIAYNGGPGNLRKWKRQYYKDDFNLFLENIPVAEPRHYCRITYQNYMHYKITYLLHR